MKIKRVKAIYFSPNKTTKEIVSTIAKGVGCDQLEEIDLTSPDSRGFTREFKEDELVIIGFPVYVDRLPVLADEIIENIQGNNTPTVVVVSYGNRDYGDALLELSDKLKERNMKIISGAAVIAQHCLNHNIATDRPDEADHQKLLSYGQKIFEKIESIQSIEDFEEVSIKGNRPYEPLKDHLVPTGDSKCTQCGLCAEECPVNAIEDEEDYRKTNAELCIFCGRCIDVCPTDARDIKDEGFLEFLKNLEVIAGERKEMELFFN